MNYHDEWTELTKKGLLPNKDYLSPQQFTTPFSNSVEFWFHIGLSCGLPLVNGLATCYYATRAVWAVMRAVGNLLILKPHYTAEALNDVCSNLTLGFCVGVMAPVHLLTHSMELLTRLIASWIVGEEPRENLSQRGFIDKISKKIGDNPNTLPSSAYFKKDRFFAPYNEALDLISQFASPVTIALASGFESLTHAAKAVTAAIDLITNIAICKPRHALENVRDIGVNFSLSLGLAIMTPINTIVEGIAFMTRLLSTWVHACGPEKQENNYRRMAHN